MPFVKHFFGTAAECQTFCYGFPGSNYFTWVDSSYFDPTYHTACHCKAERTQTSSVVGIVSGPNTCEGGGGDECCSTVRIDSTGALATGDQAHVIGTYDLVSGPDATGRYNYLQRENFQKYLYYVPTFSVRMDQSCEHRS